MKTTGVMKTAETMNPYLKNLERIEFLVTLACTGRCKHCSEGVHAANGPHIDGEAAARAIRRVCERWDIRSLMTFGGEPLLFIEDTCRIQAAAAQMGIPKRQLITNGFFSRDAQKIRDAAGRLATSGVTDILLSVDAFHQETIPLEPVKAFAAAAREVGIPLRAHPAWIKGENGDNPYDRRTAEILREFAGMGIGCSEGNIVFPGGNARKYLGEYFDLSQEPKSPYAQDPEDIRAICIGPDGGLFDGSICREDIFDILARYAPAKQ